MFKSERSSRRVKLGTRVVVVTSLVATAIASTLTPASATPRVASITVGSQTGTLVEGTAGSATYQVTVAKGTTFTLTADLSVIGLPSGATAAFDTNPLTWGSFLPAGTTRSALLTVSTTAPAAAGTTTITVRAQRNTNADDFAETTATLTILPTGAVDQTISFGSLPDRSAGDPDFTVSAIASSGLPVSFAAAGQCTVAGDVVHLTGVGSCAITASQAGGDNGGITYNTADDVQQTFAILDGSSGFDLYAVIGSMSLPGQAGLPVWGYNSSSSAVDHPGGPTLSVGVGDVVTIRLHNQLGERTALMVQGQGTVPDLTGVATGGTKAYTFTATRPGTYLYEAGLLPNAQHQVAMGLYGALVVRPAANQAYGASTTFDDEGTLVLSEIDPALNTRANKSTFDMRNFKPRYFLINGRVYNDNPLTSTEPIGTAPGNDVLLRYVNAGQQYHSMGVIGAHQDLIALDGSELNFSRRYVAETFGPGQTADTIVHIPAETPPGSRLAVHDASLLLHNSNTAGLGGMLTYLTLNDTLPGPDTVGPVASGVAYDGATLSAVVDDTTTGGSNVDQAEYFIDTDPGEGAGASMNGTFGTTSVAVSAAVSAGPGKHILYVRGHDDAGNWGVISSVLFEGGADLVGPVTRDAVLAPAHPVNGTGNVGLSATGDDTTTGGSDIQAAEYFIDTVGAPGSGTGMAVNVSAPVASLDATIPAATVAALTDGTHVISIRSQDAAPPSGNWGDPITIDLVVDKTLPTTANVVASPNPNNGTQSFTADTSVLRVTAVLTDPGTNPSGLRAGEGFIDTVGANGAGFPFAAVDGVFDEASEPVLSDIPLATIKQLSVGNHTIYVHAKDAAGNWGTTASTILVKDPFRDLYFSTVGNTLPTGVAGTADDADIYKWNGTVFARAWDATNVGFAGGANVDGYERVDATHFYLSFSGNTAVPGIGTVQDEDVVYYNAGTWTVFFDGTAAGMTTGNQDLDEISIVGGTLYFSTLGNTNPTGVIGTADDADIYSWNGGSSFTRVWDATANGFATGANVDGLQVVDTTHFYLSFTANTAVPGLGTEQDEDVVYYNGSTWSLFFDGTAHGLNVSGDLDLDAIDVP